MLTFRGAPASESNSSESGDLELILQELTGFCQDHKEQLEDIKGEITKMNTGLNEAAERVMDSEERVQNTEDILTEMLKLEVNLDAKTTNQESHSRCETLRIYGVTEHAEKES